MRFAKATAGVDSSRSATVQLALNTSSTARIDPLLALFNAVTPMSLNPESKGGMDDLSTSPREGGRARAPRVDQPGLTRPVRYRRVREVLHAAQSAALPEWRRFQIRYVGDVAAAASVLDPRPTDQTSTRQRRSSGRRWPRRFCGAPLFTELLKRCHPAPAPNRGGVFGGLCVNWGKAGETRQNKSRFARRSPRGETRRNAALDKLGRNQGNCTLVPGAGIEPARLAAGDFESLAKVSIGAGFWPKRSAFRREKSRMKAAICGTLFMPRV